MAPTAEPDFGKAIKAIREAHGWTQAEVAALVSTFYSNERAYRRIENGERLPDRDAAVAILTKGLQLREVAEINSLLSLVGYSGLTPAEVTKFGLEAVTAKATPAGRIESEPTSNRPRYYLAATIVTGAVLLGAFVSIWTPSFSVFVPIFGVLYATLYLVSLLLETIFCGRPPSFTLIAAAIFGWMYLSSQVAFALDARLVNSDNRSALAVSLSVLVVAALLQWFPARRVLPSSVVVPTSFSAHPSDIAHLKNTGYFLLLILVFWAPCVHCVLAFRRAIHLGQRQFVEHMLGQQIFVGRGIFCFSLPWLVGALALIMLLSVPMGSRLTENLRLEPRRGRYLALFYTRAFLYFGVAAACVGWFGFQLSDVAEVH